MQKQFQLKKTTVFYIILLLLLLVSVRIFQRVLFYDPWLAFFDSSQKQLPIYNSMNLYLSLFFRYALNSIISLGILWQVFKDSAIIKLSATLLFVFFIVLVGVFAIVVNTNNPSMLIVFYIRRFLIQPLFLILFLPAFYYQKHIKI